MPSHAPRTAPIKQKETLAKREARLRAAIAHDAKEDAIDVAAEHLRQSQLSVLKARRELLRYKPESADKTRELESIGADEAFWVGLPTDEIKKRYK